MAGASTRLPSHCGGWAWFKMRPQIAKLCPIVVQAWIEMASAYVKHLDPNHLVYTATIGYFGATTPSL